jgi:hypothetical protein
MLPINDELIHIPDTDKLFYHVPKMLFIAQNFNFEDIPPHTFTPQGNGNLSVNWEKYCTTPQDCLNIKTERYPTGRTSKTHGVGHFITGEVREIEFLTVVYCPSLENKAHSEIRGIPPNKPKEPYNQMRKKLQRIFKFWDIIPELDINE